MINKKILSLALGFILFLNIAPHLVQAVENSQITARDTRTLMAIDTPLNGVTAVKSISVEGWALSLNGVKGINIYLDNLLVGTTKPNISRPDVDAVYPGYPQGDTSGYKYNIDLSTYSEGSHKLKVEVVGNNGISVKEEREIKVSKSGKSKMSIDKPLPNANVTSNTVDITGWGINLVGVEKISFYLNGKLKGETKPSISRPDVINVYPDYALNNKNSGYKYTMDLSGKLLGRNKITVEVKGKDGSVIKEDRYINVPDSSLPIKTSIDKPLSTDVIGSSTFEIRGWGLHPAGIKIFNIYANGKLVLSTAPNVDRKDVIAAFPKYGADSKVGYLATLKREWFNNGANTISLEVVGEDGTSKREDRTINLVTLPIKTSIDAPLATDKINNVDVNVKGWVLHPAGIKAINIYLNNDLINSMVPNVDRPDVTTIFKGYPSGSKVGYSYTIKKDTIPAGVNKITIEVVGNDNTKKQEDRTFAMNKLKYDMAVDTPKANSNIDGNKLIISGWALSPSRVSGIHIYVDGKLIGKTGLSVSRPDVNAAFPGYPEGNMVGYSLTGDISSFSQGKHTLEVYVFSNDGHLEYRFIPFYKGSKKTIVIDPGHGGSDPGALATHNGIRYEEAKLNLAISLKLKAKLESAGYNVVMTRTVDSQGPSLEDRAKFANNSGAIFFVSIHHDSYNGSAKGSSTHYSTWRPNIDNEGTYVENGITYDRTPSQPAIDSKTIAQKMATAVSSVGFYNRGPRDHNLYVTRNTNMASVLVECGFIDSPVDILNIKDNLKQDMTAQQIFNTIKEFYK